MATARKPVLSEHAIVIVVCTIIIRVLSIGYVIGGFVLKFHLSFLDEGVVYVLDKINLGVLPLGSTLMFLFYSMMPFLLLYTIVGVIGLILIYKTTKLLLIMHAIIHTTLTALEIIYLSLISWIISETYYSTEQDYMLAHDAASSQMNWREDRDKWFSFFEKLECCSVTGKQTIGGTIGYNGYTCWYSTGCLDVIQNFTTTYGSYYIVIISVNIITSLVAVGVTEYMYRTVVIKDVTDKKMTKCGNGMFGELHKFFLSLWRRNKIIWMSGILKIFDFIYEVALGTSVLILTFSWLRDYYLKDVIWNIWKDGLSMGYLEYILTVTFLCVLLVSMGLKMLNFTAIHQKKRNLMITYMIIEFFLLLIEVIIFIFFIFLIRMLYCCLTGNESYHCHFSDSDQRNTWNATNEYLVAPPVAISGRITLILLLWNRTIYFLNILQCDVPTDSHHCTLIKLCSNNEGIWERSARNIWLSFAFLLFHIAVKLLHLVMNERIFKVISSEEKGEAGGFLYFLFVRSKKASLAAANLGLGVFIMVYSTMFLCGLLIVRYDQHSYSRITSTLHGLYHNGTSLNIGTVRDSSYVLMAVSSSLSFLAQILLYVGLYFQISKLFLIFFGVQFSLLLPQMISVILIGFPLRLVYCCLGGTDYSQCEFHSNKDDLKILCNGGSDLWISAVREIWLFWAFTLGSFVVQVISLVLCNTFYQKTFNEAGVFTLCWRSIKQKVGRLKTKVLEHPVTSIVVLAVVTLIIEVGFGITVYVYFFVNVDHTQVQQNTGELSRHIYNMRYLMNGIVYTLMVITPISTIIRPILFWLILFKRKLLLSYFFVLGFIVLVIAELVMLAQSSFLLHWAQSCGILGASDVTDWAEFCRSYDGVVYNMTVVNISFMVLHLIFNTLHIILVDRMYPVLKEDEKRRGILKICFTFIWDRIKSLFTKEKIQRFFTTIQGFSLIVEVAYGISVYALYFANFSPLDNTLQQELATFGKHRYDMQDLLNALSYTLMSFIPLVICLRVIILLTSIYKRPLFIYIIMLSIFVISVGEIVLLSQSSYILDMAYDCFIRGSSHYAIYDKFLLFCNTNVRFVFDIAAVLVSFLVLHIVLNGISFIILDQMHKHTEDGLSAKGAIVTAFSLLFASLKTSKIIAVFIVTLLLMLGIRLLFWTGLILMGLSPGYIHTELIDTLYSMHRGDMNYGRLVMGLLYSHMAMVPLDIACHFWEFFAVLKPRKFRLCSGVIIRIPWVCYDVVCLVLSSIVLRLWYCLCGSGINCTSSFPSHKTEVCQHSDLLFDSSAIMVAYVVINFSCHVLEIILSGFLIKRGTPRVSPTDISPKNQDVKSDRDSIETIAS